jgi:predicted  nucleic acid-binding Zn-ribbon protein
MTKDNKDKIIAGLVLSNNRLSKAIKHMELRFKRAEKAIVVAGNQWHEHRQDLENENTNLKRTLNSVRGRMQ